MSKFLLLLGPSGVGKSVIIEELLKFDPRFVYISPFMTRPLRTGERNKIAVSEERMDELSRCGELLTVNVIYNGIRYGTPKLPIMKALEMGNYPVLDWPIERLEVLTQHFPDRLFVVYVSPPSIDVLRQRLTKDGRDADGTRFKSAEKELQRYWASEYVGSYDMAVVSEEDKITEIATAIHTDYLRSFNKTT